MVRQLSGASEEKGALRLHYYSHMALDVIEERLSSSASSSAASSAPSSASKRAGLPPPADGFLGQLFVVEDCRVYGMATNSKVKVVTVLAPGSVAGDGVVKAWLRDVYDLYTRAAANPFHPVGADRLRSRRFDEGVDALARQYEGRA